MTESAPAPAPAAPRQGLVRWWGFGLVAGLVVGAVVVAPWWLSSFLQGKLDSALASQGWELDPEHPLTINVWTARVGGEGLRLRMIQDKQVLMECARLEASVAVLDSLSSKDLIIAELAAEGVNGSLRRGPDGRIPAVPEEKPAPGAPAIDWKKIDWKTHLEKLNQKLKERREQQQAEAEAAKAGKVVRPQPEPDIDWPQAVKHQPAITAGRHIPRVVVRLLKVSGGRIPLPDQTPFDIANFSADGTNVAARLAPGETMTLKVHVTTEGAGPADVDLRRTGDGNGSLTIEAPAVPLQAAADPAIAGDALTAWGPTGTAAILTKSTWTGWDLQGEVVAQVSGLALKPTSAAPSSAANVARVVAALKGKPIRWPVVIGGTLLKPTIVDSGLEKVLSENKDVLVDAAKEEAKDKALEKGSALIDKELKKHPEAEKAKGAAKDALKNLLGR